MRRHELTKIIVLFILWAVTSCKPKENVPTAEISEEKMVEILTDLQMVEAAHQLINLSTIEQADLRDTSYYIVYNKHGVTPQQFDSSLKVYSSYPKRFAEMIKEVEHTINATE